MIGHVKALSAKNKVEDSIKNKSKEGESDSESSVGDDLAIADQAKAEQSKICKV